MAIKIIRRADVAANWSSANPILAVGEIGVDTTNIIFKFGDGATAWNSLPIAPTLSPTQTIAWRSLGDGSDGNAVISSGTTTLSRDMFYGNLTINGTGQIATNGFRIFVAGILDLTAAPVGAINANGGAGANASGSTGGAITAINLTGSVGVGGVGTVGANGVVGNGAASTSPTAPVSANGGTGGGTGASGANGIGTAAANTAGIAPTAAQQLWARRFATDLIRGATIVMGGVGGRGGGSGAGDGTNAGGGGGGGGNGGGVVALYANIIVKSSNTPAGVIQALGGTGGQGSTNNTPGAITGGGSGGGGGGGGWIYIAFNYLAGPTIANGLQANGGEGGVGAPGFGTQNPILSGGGGGFGGYGGRITTYNIVTQVGRERYGDVTTLENPEVTTGVTAVTPYASLGANGGDPGLCQISI